MKKIISTLALSAALVSTASIVNVSAVLPPLPEGYENFDPTNINFQQFLGDDIVATLNLDCRVVSATNTPAVSAGDNWALPADGLTFGSVILDSDATVVSSCGIQLQLPTTIRQADVPISNAALAELTGTSDGIFSLQCSVNSSPEATIRLKIGGGVPGRLDVVATDLSAPIPFMCSFQIKFVADFESTLNGTVEGTVDVRESLAGSSLCSGATTITCVPITLPNSTVTVTSATGGFEGYVGSGNFTFENQFSIATVEEALGRIPIIGGLISASRFGARNLLAARKSGRISDFELTLEPGDGTAQILRPFAAPGTNLPVIRNGNSIVAVSAPNSNCSFTARKGSGAWKTVGSARANAKGVATLTLTQARLAGFLSTGVVRNGTVSVKVSCGAGGRWSDQKVVKYLG